MEKKKILTLNIVGTVFIIIVGTLAHFTYDWLGRNFIVGLFAPINESVWEHMKLAGMPMFLFGILEAILLRKQIKSFLLVKTKEIYFAVIFMIVFFYTYTGIIGHSVLFIDIASFFAAVILGRLISYKLFIKNKSVPIALSALLLLLIFAAFLCLTVAPPHLPLFLDPVSGTYGINGV